MASINMPVSSCMCACVCGGLAAVLSSKEELTSTKRRVYLTEEACAEKTRRITDIQSGILSNVSD